MISNSNSNNKWNEIDEFKGDKIYESKEGRLRAIAHIIKEYLQVKDIRSDPKTVDDAMSPIINMVLNDKEFKKFTLDNYKVLIYYDKKDSEFHIKKTTDDEMSALIKEKNIVNLNNNNNNNNNKEPENKNSESESSLKEKNKNKN
jgi:hypothetical protein